MAIGRLGFNSENKRFGILAMDLWENEGLYCGETLEVKINGEWVRDRIEMNRAGEWYLFYSKITGNDLEYLQVRY